MRKLAAVLLILLAFTAQRCTPITAFGQSRPEIVKTVLENGTTVILIEDHTAPVVSCQVFTKIGAGNEPVDGGGSALLMAESSVPGANYHYSDGEGLVLEANDEARAIVNRDFIGLLQRGSMDKFDSMLERASRFATFDLVKNNFTLKQKRLIQQNSVEVFESTYGKNDSLRAEVYQQLYDAAFGNEKDAHPLTGGKSAANLTLSGLEAFTALAGSPDKLVVVIAGDFEPAYATIVAKRWFGHRHAEKNIADSSAKAQNVKSTDEVVKSVKRLDLKLLSADEALGIGFRIPGINSPDYASLTVLATIMGSGKSSRLTSRFMSHASKDFRANVTEATLGPYGTPVSSSLFSIYLEEPPSPYYSIWQSESFISDEIARIKQTQIDEQELDTAKRFLASKYRQQTETIDGRAFCVAQSIVRTNNPLFSDETAKAIQRVSSTDVRRVANEYLVDANRTSITVVPIDRRVIDNQ